MSKIEEVIRGWLENRSITHFAYDDLGGKYWKDIKELIEALTDKFYILEKEGAEEKLKEVAGDSCPFSNHPRDCDCRIKAIISMIGESK